MTQVIPSMAAGALVLILEGETLFDRRGVLKGRAERPSTSTREEQERVLGRANPAHES
jgi:hypothetical protein